MISLVEILKSAKFADQTPEVQGNLMLLLERLNKLREAYGKPMLITSGLRTRADHRRIYAAKGITDDSKIPWGSQHLKGAAADVADGSGKLAQWCLNNVDVLDKLQLWCEDPAHTKGWVHFQIHPPKSGSRFFKP